MDSTFDPSGTMQSTCADHQGKPSYLGALDPEEVRIRLLKSNLPLVNAASLHKAMWKADIGSVASLRWILPVADILESIVQIHE